MREGVPQHSSYLPFLCFPVYFLDCLLLDAEVTTLESPPSPTHLALKKGSEMTPQTGLPGRAALQKGPPSGQGQWA